MVLATCNTDFMATHFKFMKTLVGRGLFNIFVASMCLVGDETGLLSYIMLIGLIICGLFYICVGYGCLKGYNEIGENAQKDNTGKTAAESSP